LELIAEGEESVEALPYRLTRCGDLLVYDPRPTLAALLEARANSDGVALLAARFQETIAAVTADLVDDIRRDTGLATVVLSGGVFQNQWLAETLVRRLTAGGFEVHTNHLVPANDGGISYGQAAVAAARLASAE
jgi:hydrogenase maturation protein HypF